MVEATADKPAEQAGPSGFDVLAAQATELETSALPAAQRPAAEPTPQQQAEDTAAELRGALEMARLMVAPMFGWWSEFGHVWSDATLQGIATGGAAVMQRHGWTMGEAFSQFGPYIALGGALLPPCIATHQAIKARREDLKRPPPPPPPAPPGPLQ